ncbi:uncharacterized protein FFFS_12652 [Fusarium fujikuroi]|nr:uncharacterized protein FFFS_12652 [Fusarium fujikuroi]
MILPEASRRFWGLFQADTVDAVFDAVEWVFNAIKTVIQDLIRFLELLLDWEDIKRTKNVICSIAKLFMQGQINLIASAKPFFDQEMNAPVTMINGWAGDTSWTGTIGQATTHPLSVSGQNSSTGQTSGSQMLSNHYKNNASSLTLVETDTAESGVEELVDNLLTALENENKTMIATYNNLKNIAHNISSQPLQDSLKQLVTIIADVLISILGNFGDAILDILTTLASSAMHLLDTDAPFSDNDDVSALINSDSWHTLQSILGQPPPQDELSYYSRVASYIWSAPKEIGTDIDLLNVFVVPLEADGSSDSKQNAFSGPMSVLGYLNTACHVVAGFAVPQNPISNEVLKAMHYRNIAVKVLASPILKKCMKVNRDNRGFPALDKRGMGALVKVVVGYWGLFVTAGHLYELSHDAPSSNRTAAILTEVGSILGEISNVAYCEAVNDPDRTTREVPLLVIAEVGLIEAGLEVSLVATVDK